MEQVLRVAKSWPGCQSRSNSPSLRRAPPRWRPALVVLPWDPSLNPSRGQHASCRMNPVMHSGNVNLCQHCVCGMLRIKSIICCTATIFASRRLASFTRLSLSHVPRRRSMKAISEQGRRVLECPSLSIRHHSCCLSPWQPLRTARPSQACGPWWC